MAKLNINLVPTQMIATELIDNNTGQIAGVKANPRVLRDDKFRKLKKSIQDTLLATTDSESERRRMMRQAEDEISDQYSEELKHLTFSQGAILIRLIDRETGNTSYKLVQELRGKVRAFFYQGFARLWGYNLKTEYDPKSNPEDEQIEVIATLLERGQI